MWVLGDVGCSPSPSPYKKADVRSHNTVLKRSWEDFQELHIQELLPTPHPAIFQKRNKGRTGRSTHVHIYKKFSLSSPSCQTLQFLQRAGSGHWPSQAGPRNSPNTHRNQGLEETRLSQAEVPNDTCKGQEWGQIMPSRMEHLLAQVTYRAESKPGRRTQGTHLLTCNSCWGTH